MSQITIRTIRTRMIVDLRALTPCRPRDSAAAVHEMTNWRHRDWRRASRSSGKVEQKRSSSSILSQKRHLTAPLPPCSEVFSPWTSFRNNGRNSSGSIAENVQDIFFYELNKVGPRFRLRRSNPPSLLWFGCQCNVSKASGFSYVRCSGTGA